MIKIYKYEVKRMIANVDIPNRLDSFRTSRYCRFFIHIFNILEHRGVTLRSTFRL